MKPKSEKQNVSYLNLSEENFLKRIEKGRQILKSCNLCGNLCRVDRLAGSSLGKCGIDGKLKVSSINLHYGEEPPISGSNGSGTVFLTGCCLSCVFCQNYPISQLRNGTVMESEGLGKAMVTLQERGAYNINFVSPTHQVPGIVEAIYHGRRLGLTIPIVYNTGGYDSKDCLELLDGIVDIYLPDFKYADNEVAMKISGVRNYFEVATEALSEMCRQVGDLATDVEGIATRGVMVRHLVLPEGQAQTKEVFRLIKDKITTKIHISLLGQYFPAYKSLQIDNLKRKITAQEYKKALADVIELGFENVYQQEIDFAKEE
jgi:putative pyruvate formate lyase activating enzyme